MNNEELVLKIQKGENIKANMEKLYSANKGLIYQTIKKYAYIDKMTDINDLMQQAYEPLYKAALNFKPCKGITFITYALQYIKGNIKRYLDDVGHSVRLPVHMQEKIYKYHQATNYFLERFNREPTEKEYMNYLSMTKEQLCRLQKSIQTEEVQSLNKPIGKGATIGDVIADSGEEMEAAEQKIDKIRLSIVLWDTVEEIIKDSEKVNILKSRYKEQCTLKECGKRYGLTLDMVYNREKRSLKKLRSNRKIREIGEAEEIVKPIRPHKEDICQL